MEKKSNSLSRVKRRQQEKVLRFSIRKYSFGAASVAVAALMFLGARVVSADIVTPVDKPHVGALTQDTSPLASQDKEEPASSVKVDTATASQLVVQLKDQLHVKEAANTDLLVAAKEELVKAEQTLADSKVSQVEVDALVARLTNVLDQLRAVETPQVKEEEKNDRSAQGVTSEISAKSEETSENTNAEQLEKAKASLKVSIDRLEQAIAQTPENDLTREILEKANAQVAVAKSAFGGVEVSLRDVEDMNRVIKRNESSVMIARNRLTSGRNDVRNGAAIPVGTTLRADAGATYDNAVGLYFTKEGDGSGYPAGTMLFRDRNQNTADKQRVKDVKDVVKVDVTKNGDTYDWVIEFEGNPENHQNAHAWFTIPTGHTLVDDGSASFGSYWGGSGGKRRIETQGRLPRNLYDIFKDQVSSTSKDVNIGTPGGAIEQAWGKAATTDAFWKGADGEIKTFEEIISKPDTLYFNRTGGARTTTEKDVLVSDYLKDWLIQHTQRVYHFDIDYRGRTKDSASNYIFRFKTKAAEGTPLMYAAGMRSYEFSTHRNDMQWYGLPSPKVTGADQTIEKGKEIRLEFTTKDNLAGFSLGDPKLGYNPADSIKLVDSKLELKDQKVEVQKVSDYEHKLIITGRVASDPGDYKVKVKSVNNVGQSAEFTSTVKVTQSITPTLELNQDPKTGDVTVTPKKPDGSTYPPETKVEIPGKGDKPIPVTIGKDGKGKVPNSDLPEGNVPGIGKITEPGQPTVEVPDVTTPAKIIPADQVAPTITKLTDNRNAEIDSKNPRKIIVYREEEFSVDVNLTDNSGRLDKIKVHDNAQAVAPSGNFEVTNGGRLDLPANGTSINFTDKTSNLGQAGNATDTNPYKVNISGHVGKDQVVNTPASRNIWNRYISGYDQEGLTNNSGNNGTANNANIQIEFRKQSDKYTPTAVTGSKIDVATDGTISGYNTPETYIANKSELPTKGTTAGTTTTYAWKDGETPTVNNGQVTRTAVVTYPDGSTDEVPVTFTVRDTVAPTITSLTPISNAEIDSTNPHKIIVYREEEFSVDVNLTDNSGQLDKIKVHDNAQAVAPSGNFEVTNGGRLDLPANGTKIDFTDKTSNLGQAGNATDTNPYKVNISGHVGKNQVVNTPASRNIWNRYISGYDQEGLTNNSGNNGTANNANIQIEFRKQSDKYTPTATNPTVKVTSNGTVPDLGSPETYIANKSDLPTKGTTPGTRTTYAWKDGETPTVNNGQVTRTVIVTYPDGSTDEVPVTVKVVDPRTDAEKNNPTPQEQTVNVGETPDPKKSIGNVGDLPKGTTVEYKTPVDTTTPGDKKTTAVVTYPDGSKDEVPVTVKVVDPRTDADKNTPTVELEQDPKTGDVTVTPKKPDGSTYKPGTKVEIPGKDGKPIPVTIGEDGKGKVPNSDLPDGKVSGPGKITEPNKPAVEVPKVETPAKVTPETPETEKPGKIEIDRKPNGDAIVTPKKPDGTTYPSGSKVEIPGENGTPITVTIGDNGSGEVPNDNLPKKDVPGTGTVTEPNKKPSQPVDVTTPARKTPTVDVEQDPKTGDVTVTPKRPDGSTYPPGTKVEIPGKDGNPITVTIGEDGKGKVPNSDLPDGKVSGPGKITEPGKPAVEVPVETPAKVTPETPETEKPGKIEIDRKPNGDAIVTPKKPDGTTYPSGSKVEIPGENGTPITVEIGEGGKGKVPNDKLPKKDVPGTGTVTEPNKKPSQPVDVTTPARKTPTVDVEQDPKTGDVTVTPKKPDGTPYKPGTKVEIPGKDGNPITVTIGEDGKGKVPNSELPDGKVPGTGKITEPGQPAVEVPVETPAKVTPETPVTEKPGKIEITQQPNGNAIVTPKKPDGSTYPPGTTVEIPGENGTPITVTIGDNGSGEVPNDNLPKNEVPGTGTVTEPNKKPSQPVDVTTPAQKTPTVDVEQDPKTGDVTVTPKRPDGSTFPPGTKVEIPGKDGNPITVTIGEDGKGKVPNSELPDGKVPGTGKITEPGKPAVEVPVTTPGKVTPNTPTTETPSEIEITRKPNGDAIVTPKKPDGSTYPSGSKVVIPGENNTPIEVTIGDNGSGEVPNDKLPKKDVPGTGTVTEPNKKPSQPVDVTTPARKTPTVDVEQDPKTGDVTVTPKKPDGSTFPPGTKVEIPGKDGNPITVTIGEDGKGKVPNSELPDGKVPGTGKITEPGKPAVEVPVTTPGKVTPETPTTETPSEIEITRKPNGDAIVTPKKPDGSTYPSGSKVVIPGENNTPIEVTIGDNGSGEVPNDNLPKKDVPGTGTVTEPNKKPSQPVDVTTPAQKTPTLDVEQDPKTGDVTVTPKKPDGSTFPPGTKVEIPGKDGNPITVTIGEDGKGKVPNSELPDGKVPGTGKITEPGKPAVEVPVTTPGKVTPNTPTTETPSEIEITRKPNGDAIVTPKKPDGSTYPSGSKVVIPGENNTPIEVTIGDNGSGEVPNDKLPKKDVPGTGTVTEPNKKPSQPVDVTTPARKTPTVDVEQDPKTGDVTVTPKKPDGSTFPPGTTVEIPGKDGNPITVTIGEDGKGKVPNSELPDGKVPGTGKITEPGKPAVEVPVTTPGKVTPETPTTETPSEIEITRKPNGDAVVTPKKPDGKPYLPGTKVEIPSKDKDGNPTTITVTVGDNGSGEVPNDNLPKKDVPGTGTVTEPNKKPSQPVDVTTPARKTPTIELDKDPKTGDVTVTPQRPGGGTYPPGTKVEIPGEDGPITVEIGQDGKGKVPNDNLPKKDVPGTGKITEPGKPAVEVPVTTPGKVTPETPTTETPSEIEITRKPNGDAVVTPKKPDGKPYLPGTKVEIPSKDKDGNPTTITVTVGDNGSGEVPNDNLPKKDVPGTGTVTEPNKKPSQPVDVTTPARKTPTIELDKDPKTGDVTVTPQRPGGGTYPPGTKVEIPGEDGPITVEIGQDGKGKVPNDNLPKKDVPGTGKITEPGKPAVEVPVTTPGKVTPETPTTETPSEIEITRKPNGDAVVTPKKPDGKPYLPGTKVEIPSKDKDGNPTTITVTVGDNGSGEVPNDNLPKKDVPGTGTVTEPNKKPSQPVDVTTPARKTPTVDVEQDPKTGDVTVTPKKPDGSTFPPGTKVEIPGKDGNPITVTIGEDGKGKVPNSELPDGKVPGTGKITEPGKPAVEVPVTTPGKVTPNTPTTETPSEIEITRKPNGDAVVTPKKPDGSTYPSGSKVVIPGENNTPIEVTIGDNGSGEVPNDKLPKKDVPGTGTVTEPNKKPSQPVDVTTPARKTPTVELDKDPKTGDVTVTPKKPDGSTYPPGTTVEIPGEDGPIIVEIGQDGKGKVPNDKLPKKDVPGTGKITEPGKPAVEVPVTTPGKVTPATPVTEQPGKIEITRKPNGDVVVTPKKPDGKPYPPGTKVEIPGENGTPITVTIGDNGSGEVPNDKLPKKDVPGTGTVTEPNKKPSQPVDVTTPARKTPTVDVEQDPKTGDVTVTPKKPDGSTYPPGTKVEIPGKDGTPITVTIGEDGKGKVPNSELPDGKVPGTGKITEPGQPAVEVPVETPAKVTPVAVNPNVNHGDTTATNDNGAKSNDSQKVLPNTGTESNATLASLGLLGILGGLGLALGKKKED